MSVNKIDLCKKTHRLILSLYEVRTDAGHWLEEELNSKESHDYEAKLAVVSVLLVLSSSFDLC